MTHVSRREFLRLKRRGEERVVELSCEPLYMQWTHARTGVTWRRDAAAAEPESGVWDGEPALEVAVPTVEELFAEVERRLSGADVLQVRGREWLAVGDFRRELERRVDAFRQRGGRVE
jgi:hypothetical protein